MKLLFLNLFLLICLCFTSNIYGQNPPIFSLVQERITVDTGICSAKTPVIFRLRSSVKFAYKGLDYGVLVDFGDGNTFQQVDTVTYSDVFYFTDYKFQHTYQTLGNKVVRYYMLDSNYNKADSVIRTYNVGGCKKAVGILHADGIPNCKYDVGELVHRDTFMKFLNNSDIVLLYIDSNGVYNIPVFPGDAYGSKPGCSKQLVTYDSLRTELAVGNINGYWGYIDTLRMNKDHVCIDHITYFYFTLFYKGNPSNSQMEFRIRPDWGDGTPVGLTFAISGGTKWDMIHVFKKPGMYNCHFTFFNSKTNQNLFEVSKWVYADSCRKCSVKLYYDQDSNCTAAMDEKPLDSVYTFINSSFEGRTLLSQRTDAGGFINDIYVYKGDTMRVDTFTYSDYGMKMKNVFDSLVCSPYITFADSVYEAGFVPRRISGYVYLDKNKNCAYDTTDKPIKGQTVIARSNKGVYRTTVTDSTGRYEILLAHYEDYQLSVPPTGITGHSTACTGPVSIIKGAANVNRFDFAYQCDTAKNAAVRLFNYRPVRGATDTLTINLSYNGCDDKDSARLVVTLDSNLSYIKSSPIPDTVKGRELIYRLHNLFEDVFTPVKINYVIPAVSSAVICNKAEIIPYFTDTGITDNAVTLCDSVINNNNQYQYKSLNVQKDSLGNRQFIYTIYFQNLDSVIVSDVAITDTLDAGLDPASFRMLYSSHQVVPLLSGNVLYFKLQYINLLPAKIDSAKSKGYIRFRVEPVQPASGIISNRAIVYFDSSGSAQTNTVFYDVLNPYSVKSYVDELELSVYPNPVKESFFVVVPESIKGDMLLTVFTLGDKVVLQRTISAGENEIQFSSAAPGMYFIHVSGNGHSMYGKLIRQ